MKQLLGAQAELWSGRESDTGFAASHIAEYLDIPGSVDALLFAAAARRIIEEYPLLRLGFRRQGGEILPFVRSPWDPVAGVSDVSHHPDPLRAVLAVLRDAETQPFDIEGPLLECRLFKLSDARFIWHARYHSGLTDGVGVWMVARRLSELYNASLERREPPVLAPVSFEMLLDDEARYVASGRCAADASFWSQYLDGSRPGSGFPRHSGACAEPHIRISEILEPQVAATIFSMARRLKLPVVAVLIGAAFLYLHRLTGERDLLLGLVVAAREGLWRRTPARSMNVVPLRVRIEPAATLREIAPGVAHQLLEIKRRWRHRGAELRHAAYETHGVDPRRPSINIMAVNDIRFGGHLAAAHEMTPDKAAELNLRFYISGQQVAIDFVAPSSLYSADDLRAYACGLYRLFPEEAGEGAP